MDFDKDIGLVIKPVVKDTESKFKYQDFENVIGKKF